MNSEIKKAALLLAHERPAEVWFVEPAQNRSEASCPNRDCLNMFSCRIRFTVVSEPPEEEEQDRECEDVGVAFLRIPEILEKQRDVIEEPLNGENPSLDPFVIVS